MYVIPRGHIAFGILWSICMLVIIVGFSGVGGLVFAPLLLLLFPFGFARSMLRSMTSGTALWVRPVLLAVNFITELAMVAAFVWLYNLAILTYCPPRY